ncbi:hypothetical protein H1W00_04070 [Aeromicrobium sp. Marseille-Q0843]|uniref:PknH-like extracellular domain-containing protein n=1 Tax=Aeromicrobium phoceense TaxID=2754045 RepID=A0A838XAR3_9ACTN|nr:hypothetical protein [Aeromicrobium phoceense]MBA4607645.1 hypothetical protein [Aeromicrobium phoceense]
MKSVVLALVVSSALVLAGCGPSGPGVDPDEYGAVVEEAPSELLTEVQIQKALLTVNDLPDGWSFNSDFEGGGEDDSRTTSEDPGCEEFTAGLTNTDGTLTAGEAEVTFSKSEYGPFLTQTIRSKGGDDAVKSMKSFKSALKGCDFYTMIDGAGGVRTDYVISDLPFPDLGDDTVALTMRATTEGQTIDLPMAIVRVDHTLVMLATFQLGGGTGTQEFEAVARTAVKKVKKASA